MMKRFFTAVLLFVLLVFTSVFCLAAEVGSESFVFDDANLLSSSEESALSDKLREISHENGIQIVVATVNGTDGKSAESFISYFYDSKELGYGESRD